ncbi:MAG: hypothetical protein ACRD1I_06640, partial [Terriglobia bacterium]
MAFNKSKALEEAARLVSQRKLPQAIRQYLLIVDQDPQDLPLHNIVGDLWVREGNVREALREFHILADAYTHEGFILKAIAIYKKIVKLDTQSPEPLIRLAELYSGQKFSHEANEQYAQALAVCERHSLHDQAGRILKKLVIQDPENAVYQTRLAEFLQKTGQSKEACQTFLQVAELAYHRKNIPGASAALRKAAEIEPQNPRIALFRAKLAAGAKEYAEVERIFRNSPEIKSDAGGRSILLGVYLDSGRLDEAATLAVEACRESAGGFDALRQFAAHCLEAGKPGAALHALDEVAEAAFKRNQTQKVFELLQRVLAAQPRDPASLDMAAALCERASPEHVPSTLLESLGKGFGENGQWAKAERAFRPLTDRDQRNAVWQSSLKEAIEKQLIAPIGKPAAEEAVEPPPLSAGSIETVEAPHASEAEKAPEAIEAIEVDFSAEWETFSASRPPSEPEGAEKLSLEIPQLAAQELTPVPSTPIPVAPAPATVPLDPMVPLDVLPFVAEQDLDEEKAQVEFYLDSGFLAEAEAALKSLAARHPGHAQIQELQERLRAASSPGDEPPSSAPAEAAPSEPDVAPVFLEEEAGIPSPAAAEPRAQTEVTAPLPAEEVPELQSEVASAEPDVAPVFLEEEAGIPSPAAAEPQDLVEDTAPPPAEEVPDSQLQVGSLLDDLAQDLAMALGDTGELRSTNEGEAPYLGEGGRSLFDSALEELLTELEAGQPAVPATDSPQTHYNLGVAFREMGLLDEAIGEFQKVVKGRIAADNPPRFLEASSLLGNCFMEKQMPE